MIHRRHLLAALAALAASGFLLHPARARQATADTLEITGGFARATPPMAVTGAAFLTITSRGPADRLVGFTSPACARPELHRHIDDGGIMRMRQVAEIDLPAGGSVALAPGGYHLMMIDLTAPLVEGETVAVTLLFEAAGPVTVTLPILGPDAM